MIYGSVSSGIEAATMAWHSLGWTAKFFSEIAPFPSAVLAHRYGSNMPGEPLAKNGIPNHGDFTKIGADAGPVDLLVGGTPCQSFSIAGKRLGLDDPRGNLALEYLALAKRLGARWFLWENVPGVLSSRSGHEPAEDEEGEGIESADFATFLDFVRQCGYGFAYRILDAQYVRVDGYARAVPQRRRRMFVVGYIGDWRPAAAVLFEPEGMRRDPAPRRKAGKNAAHTIASRTTGGGGLGTDFELDGGLIPQGFGGGNTAGPIDVSTALTAHGHRIDFEVETFVAELASTLPAGGNSTGGDRQPGMSAETAATMLVSTRDVAATLTRGADSSGKGGYAGRRQEDHDNLVAHALRAEGFDASEDGTGRGTPIVPIMARPAVAIQAGALRENISAGPDGAGVQEGVAYTLEARAEVQAVAFQSWASSTNSMNPDVIAPTLDKGKAEGLAVAFDMRGRDGGAMPEGPHDTANIRAASGSSSRSYVAEQWAVRRLTPRECERLQGFPDDFTNVPWRGKEISPDGPRYKALGNSMAVNVMRWIGQRIDIMEGLIQSGRVTPGAHAHQEGGAE